MTTGPVPHAPTSIEPVPELAAPTAVGFVLRVLAFVLYVGLAAAVLIPLQRAQPVLAIAIALLVAGIGRTLLAVHGSWLAIVAIPVALGVAATMMFASPMLTLLTGDRVPFTVGEFSEHSRCTVHEVGGDRVIEGMACSRGGERWQEGDVVELSVGGVLPHTMDDGTPWEADRLEETFSWVLPVAITSLVVGLALRVVKVWQTWWRPARKAGA